MSSPALPPADPPVRKIGVAAVVVQEGKLLVIRRSELVRAAGRYCFPGGSMERGETEEQTLVREMEEELGITVRPVRRLHRSITPWRVDLRWWMAECDPDAKIMPHPAEVDDVFWYSVAELRALEGLLDSNRYFLDAWEKGEFEIDGLCRAGGES